MNALLVQLKQARHEKGLTQSELGKKLGLPQSHISTIERGETDPRLSTVTDYARLVDQVLIPVPRKLVPAIRSMMDGQHSGGPMWTPDEGDES